MEYDADMAAADVVHFPADFKAGYRSLGQIATTIAFNDWQDELWLKRFLKYAVHYVPQVFDIAARVIDVMGAGAYSSIHIRRNDLQYKTSWTAPTNGPVAAAAFIRESSFPAL